MMSLSPKKMALLLFSFILLGCTNTKVIKPKFSGDHTTQQIREMWHICFNSIRKSTPYLPPLMHMTHCDCVIDASREKYSITDYKKQGEDNLTKFFTEASKECNDDKIKTTEVPIESTML